MNADLTEVFKTLKYTPITKKIHSETYPAISPLRPELSQRNRTILITGGGTGVGFSTAKAFIQASASALIILGRRSDVLSAAALRLEEEAKVKGTGTKIIARTCDVTKRDEVEKFWAELKEEGIVVDVFVANAAKFTEPKPILELGADEVWSQMEVNVKAPLYFVEKFAAQPGEGQKFIVHLTSAVIHQTHIPAVAQRPAYILSKMTGTHLFQLIAMDTPPEKIQIVTFHPGLVYGDGWKAGGVPNENFDSDDLCGTFAVWAASKEAEFLHGRMVWAPQDVEELSTGAVRKLIDSDSEFLKVSIVGANAEP